MPKSQAGLLQPPPPWAPCDFPPILEQLHPSNGVRKVGRAGSGRVPHGEHSRSPNHSKWLVAAQSKQLETQEGLGSSSRGHHQLFLHTLKCIFCLLEQTLTEEKRPTLSKMKPRGDWGVAQWQSACLTPDRVYEALGLTPLSQHCEETAEKRGREERKGGGKGKKREGVRKREKMRRQRRRQ